MTNSKKGMATLFPSGDFNTDNLASALTHTPVVASFVLHGVSHHAPPPQDIWLVCHVCVHQHQVLQMFLSSFLPSSTKKT